MILMTLMMIVRVMMRMGRRILHSAYKGECSLGDYLLRVSLTVAKKVLISQFIVCVRMTK
jgi:hypothetical protein